MQTLQPVTWRASTESVVASNNGMFAGARWYSQNATWPQPFLLLTISRYTAPFVFSTAKVTPSKESPWRWCLRLHVTVCAVACQASDVAYRTPSRPQQRVVDICPDRERRGRASNRLSSQAAPCTCCTCCGRGCSFAIVICSWTKESPLPCIQHYTPLPRRPRCAQSSHIHPCRLHRRTTTRAMSR